jgi:Arc/MetJ family transcription regulator
MLPQNDRRIPAHFSLGDSRLFLGFPPEVVDLVPAEKGPDPVPRAADDNGPQGGKRPLRGFLDEGRFLYVSLDNAAYTPYSTQYKVYKMRTNVVIDDTLMKEAMSLSRLRTKRVVVHKALEEYVRNLKKKDLREIQGKIRLANGYDYKKMRQR